MHQVPGSSASAVPEKMAWMADNLLTSRILKSIEAFRTLSMDQLEQAIRVSRTLAFGVGEVVSTRGTSGRSGLVVILTGSVTVTRPNPADPTTPEVLGRLGTGEHFGAKNLVDASAPRETDVTADTPMRCLLLEAGALGDLLRPLQHALARELASRRWILENRGKVAIADLESVRTVGVGAFGRVKLVVHSPTQKTYALKIISRSLMIQQKQEANVLSERALLSTCSHPFLLKLAATFETASRIYMLLEFIQGGELFRLIVNSEEQRLSLPMTTFYAASTFSAFAYLGSLNIVYRDLKTENLMLNAHGHLKVIDLGFAKVLKDGKAFTLAGTPDYMAPEVVTHRGYDARTCPSHTMRRAQAPCLKDEHERTRMPPAHVLRARAPRPHPPCPTAAGTTSLTTGGGSGS